jgi:chemotaxis protein CheY-P-specific phosphatase CheC
MFGEIADKQELPHCLSDCLLARITFSGAAKGALVLAVPAPLCAQIAANVLGIDEDDELPPGRPADALKELLNVICGHVLTALAGEAPVFNLSVPEVSPLDEAHWTALVEAPATVGFRVDDVPVLLQLAIEET